MGMELGVRIPTWWGEDGQEGPWDLSEEFSGKSPCLMYRTVWCWRVWASLVSYQVITGFATQEVSQTAVQAESLGGHRIRAMPGSWSLFLDLRFF